MYTEDAIKHFGSKRKLAQAAGVKTPTVYAWGKLVPEKRAFRLHRLTSGQLKYDPALYEQPDSPDAA
ncbi:Cro/CI family transcriptional regulator [Pectobacterium brasiliense]|uniref:Cro/CI family transcriptional regulator n=1 Tax=Pectobacterium brasiliense TaxID=180957 RepID=UPI00300E0C53